ncbi:MAG TPA: organomercurial lyase [Planctomycetota bacterium]|nr:organomercurial lyase [Planctomycetota bacterium]
MGKVGKVAVILALVVAVVVVAALKSRKAQKTAEDHPTAPQPAAGLPRLVDLGSTTCIPCKMMAPILEDLKKDYAGRLQVEFIDVVVNPQAAKPYGIKLIPTQIFFDAEGKELWRHEGFISKEDILGKWKELGHDFGGAELPKIERWEPVRKDTRTKDEICYLCDGDVNPRTAVVVRTGKGDVRLCGPHCYFIMYSCLTEDRTGFEKKVSVTDWATGEPVPAMEAVYLCGADEKSGRPWVKAFADRDAAAKETRSSGGNTVTWQALGENELSHRCGFCDRAVYPVDVAKVVAGGVHSYGCCAHCAMGVAARTGKDIEVHQPDGLTGEMIVVKTLDGSVASIEPGTAVAWFGMRKKPDGNWGSAGCFHQGFFLTADNLKKWLEEHPFETGKIITIQQSLADKMKLTPQQIQKACKIGECAPK